MNSQPQMLADVRVVEMATMVFAPSACVILADFGARVIKLEPPRTGDLNRHYHTLPGMPRSDVAYTFEVDNRNKQSVALDVKTEAGYEAACKLVASADVFVTNYRPAALARLRMSWNDLRAVNPRLIYACGSAYGEEGDECDQPGYDAVCYWARSGIESHVFPVDGWLGAFPYGSGDHPSGTALFGAVMLGLRERDRTGKGSKVSTSLLANGAWANATMLQAQLCQAEFFARRPRHQSYNFTYIHYRTRDGRLLKLSIVNAQKDWAPFCRAIARPDLIDDARFARLDDRVERMDALIGIIDEAFAEHDLAYWKCRLAEFDVPFAVLPTYPEAADDAQKHANRIVVPLAHPEAGAIHTVSSPMEVTGYAKATPSSAPKLGQHTCDVLRELGYADDEIERMVHQGAAEQWQAPREDT